MYSIFHIETKFVICIVYSILKPNLYNEIHDNAKTIWMRTDKTTCLFVSYYNSVHVVGLVYNINDVNIE